MLAGDVTVRLQVLPCGDLVVFLNIVQDIEKLPYCKIKIVLPEHVGGHRLANCNHTSERRTISN